MLAPAGRLALPHTGQRPGLTSAADGSSAIQHLTPTALRTTSLLLRDSSLKVGYGAPTWSVPHTLRVTFPRSFAIGPALSAEAPPRPCPYISASAWQGSGSALVPARVATAFPSTTRISLRRGDPRRCAW
jgi:hypothetical protein